MTSELLSNAAIQFRDTVEDEDDMEVEEDILDDNTNPNIFTL